jgi:hypothetical protein
MTRQAGVTRFIRSLPGNLYSGPEVARILGVHDKQIQRLRDHPELGPSKQAPWSFSKRPLYLYDQKDIESLRAYFAERSTVVKRQPKDRERSAENRRLRTALHSKAYYHRKRLNELAEAGDLDGVAKHREILDQVAEELSHL